MKTSKLKKIIYGIGISLFFSQGFLNIACSDWTDIEAKDYYEPPTQGYENNLKDYLTLHIRLCLAGLVTGQVREVLPCNMLYVDYRTVRIL